MRTATKQPVGLALAQALPDAQFFGDREIFATSCTSEADAVRPGDVFFAVEEADCDGHELASRAIDRGAKAIVVERPLALFHTPQILVEDSRQAYGEFCQHLVGLPSDHLPVIGIAGSAGKTSTATLLRAVLRTAAMTPGHIVGDEMCDGTITRSGCRGKLTSPALATWLARMVIRDCSHAILELSTDWSLRRVAAGVTFDVACFTNLDRENQSCPLADARRAHEAVLNMLPANGVAVTNADDPNCNKLLSKLDCPAITFGMKRPAEITATIVSRNACEQEFILSNGQDFAAVRTTVIGDSHVYNCLAAAAVATVYDINLTTIARGLESVTKLDGVMQRIDSGQEFCTFIDRARSSRSIESCLKAAREITRGNVITVIPNVDGTSLSRELLTTAEKLSDVIIHARHGKPSDAMAQIAEACLQADAGDVVLVAGADGLVRDESGESWGDEEVLREIIRQMQVV